MKPLQRLAFIGNQLPRRCGIATFTHDLQQSIATARPDLETCIVAMTDRETAYDYAPAVGFEVRDDIATDYVKAAQFLNNGQFDAISLQHEYGIFGGEAGGNILELLLQLNAPIVTTLHTVLTHPTSSQFNVMRQIIDASETLVVMAGKGRELLQSVHGVHDRKIVTIPHGVPDFPFVEPDRAKARFGYSGKMVILTFGLLSPSKGIETVIDAMPAIVEACPNAVYVVLGASHPNLVRDQGEAYRNKLMRRALDLGMAEHVVFVDQFVDQPTLLAYISMCDLYVTPYLNEAQMTSGTLAYSFGLGKAVVSTPYWHAKELLGSGRGSLVPFGDATAIGDEISALLTDDVRRTAMRKRAFVTSRAMTWAATAKRYLATFEAAIASAEALRGSASVQPPPRLRPAAYPEVNTGHLLAMCDSTGLLQHAVFAIPDRAHGYCVDDNARALLLSSALCANGEHQLPAALTTSFAAFIQHAWNPDTQRFRNFMSYDRRWLEPVGSEDSHGRTLWALGECACKDIDPARRGWARALFATALNCVENFTSPRAWAFTLLGLDAYSAKGGGDLNSDRIRKLLAERLFGLLAGERHVDWNWFEDFLAYDNARLPQALIQSGRTMQMPHFVAAGLQSLRWLIAIQTAPSGCFRPVGSSGFGAHRQKPTAFDQQPIEAAATISACLVASRVDGRPEWAAEAKRAFEWFVGGNDLKISLIEPATGSCLDGLHPDRPNANAGAESVLSYLAALIDVRSIERRVMAERGRMSAQKVWTGDIDRAATLTHAGNHVVTVPIPEPTFLVPASRPGTRGREAVQTGNRAEGS